MSAMNREAIEQLRELYADLDDEIERLGWTCRACGECCNFREHGHELFCSQLEAECLIEDVELPDRISDDVCVFVVGGKCTRREGRTIACRTYFCTTGVDEKVGEIGEEFIRRLKALHKRLGVAWRYDRLSAHLRRRKACNSNG